MNNNSNGSNGPDMSRSAGLPDRSDGYSRTGMENGAEYPVPGGKKDNPDNSRGVYGYEQRYNRGSETGGQGTGSDYSRRVSGYGERYSKSYGQDGQTGSAESGYARRMSGYDQREQNSSEQSSADRQQDSSSYSQRVSGSGHEHGSEYSRESGSGHSHSHSGGSGHRHSHSSGSVHEHRSGYGYESGSGHRHSHDGSSGHRHSGGYYSDSGSADENISGYSGDGGSGHRHSSDGSEHYHREHSHHHSGSDSASSEDTGSGKKINTRKAVSILFAFLLSIIFVCGSMLCILQNTFSQKTARRLTISDEYISLVKQEIYDNAIDYTLPTGIDASVLDNVFIDDEIKEDIEEEVRSAYESGEEYTPTAYKLRERLRQSVERYFETIDVSSEQENNALIIQEYVDDIIGIYTTGIKVTGLKYLVSAGSRFRKYSTIALIGIVILSVYLIVLMTKIHHYMHHAMRYVSYSAGASALMLFIAPFIVWASKGYKRIGVTPQSLYHLVVSLVEAILKKFFGASLFWVLIAAALIALIYNLTGKNDSKRMIKHYIKKKTIWLSDMFYDKYYKVKRFFNR